jgi:hypothetical protein
VDVDQGSDPEILKCSNNRRAPSAKADESSRPAGSADLMLGLTWRPREPSVTGALGPIQAERVAADLLGVEGFTDVEPKATLGGPDASGSPRPLRNFEIRRRWRLQTTRDANREHRSLTTRQRHEMRSLPVTTIPGCRFRVQGPPARRSTKSPDRSRRTRQMSLPTSCGARASSNRSSERGPHSCESGPGRMLLRAWETTRINRTVAKSTYRLKCLSPPLDGSKASGSLT